MKLQLGSSILLVFILSLACLTPTRAYYYEDEPISASTSSVAADTLASGDVTSNNSVPDANLESTSQVQQPEKREFGTPSTARALSSSTFVKPETSSVQDESPDQGQSKIDEISPPVNPPLGSNSKDANQETSEQETQQQASSARGLGSKLMSALGNGEGNPSGEQQSQNPPSTQQSANPPSDQVSQENLPTIIEKNKPVDPSQAKIEEANGDKTQIAPGAAPISTARTFDSWTNCVGSTSNKYGTCKNDIECSKHKGKADGSCMGGLGVCCVMALSCGDKSIENNTFFANPDFPEPSWEARQCYVELTKKHIKVTQIMIEFDEFELAPPNQDGECITDVFQVRLSNNKHSPYSSLRICGQNTGQHMYLDVSQLNEPIVLSVTTSGGGFPRRWSIRIVQMDEHNFLQAPPGCLQYYTDTVGHFRSFNLGKNLKNLYYAICFRIDNGYSGLRFTSNFFGMNGPFCRKKIVSLKANSSLIANPHTIVIPSAGSAYPLPKPSYNAPTTTTYTPGGYGQTAPRYRRDAPPEPPNNQTSNPRTLSHLNPFGLSNPFASHEKEAKLEEKEFDKHLHHHHPLHHHPLPPPPPQVYPAEYQPGKGGLGGYGYEHEKFEHPKHHEHFGWKGKTDFKQEGEYQGGYKQPYGHQPYGQHQYGYQSYGHNPHGEYQHQKGGYGEHYEHKHDKNHHLVKDDKSSSWWHSLWRKEEKDKDKFFMHHEALFPLIRIPELPHCEPRYCGSNDVITFPPSGDSIAEMCGNLFNRGRGPKIISGSPLVVYVSNRGQQRGSGFDMNYEQVFFIPKPY